MIGGQIQGAGLGEINLIFIQLDSDLQYCGSLTQSSVSFDVTDVTYHGSLIFTPVSFTESSPTQMAYSRITSSLIDFNSQLNVLAVE